ncbi:MAG: hypothetical protein JNK49_21820, partial [Planctomycetes bacterium]|nr:hypothetical protein [Planctomycetota bacterium]
QFVSFLPGTSPIGGCQLALGLPMVGGPAGFADAFGAISHPFPIPTHPSYLGLNFFFQYGVADPGGVIWGAFASTGGLQVRIGS